VSNSQRIYEAAKRYLGTKETLGSASTPLIKLWIAEAANWLDTDDSKTPWCGCFRGFIGMVTASGLPKAHYQAASWATWGKPVEIGRPDLWQRGDTIVMTRSGGNHVCLLDRVSGDYAYCLGGNQSDAVTISRFPLSRITAVRRG
jgi:uncharacterized protein (TIGR02594 family)